MCNQIEQPRPTAVGEIDDDDKVTKTLLSMFCSLVNIIKNLISLTAVGFGPPTWSHIFFNLAFLVLGHYFFYTKGVLVEIHFFFTKR